MPSSTETTAPTTPATAMVAKRSLPFWLIEPATAELNDTIASWPSEICPAKPVMMSNDSRMMATMTPPVKRLTRLAFHPNGRNRSSTPPIVARTGTPTLISGSRRSSRGWVAPRADRPTPPPR